MNQLQLDYLKYPDMIHPSFLAGMCRLLEELQYAKHETLNMQGRSVYNGYLAAWLESLAWSSNYLSYLCVFRNILRSMKFF